MEAFRLPAQTHIGPVHLRVSDLRQSLDFYTDLLGFQEIRRQASTAFLSATGSRPYHILLTEHRGARPKPSHTTGLNHVAIRLPNRRELARLLKHLQTHDWPIHDLRHHNVSDALYLDDPDHNGLELCVDTPEDQWIWRGSELALGNDPLDADNLLGEVAEDMAPWSGIHPETDIGHVHLYVSDLAQAEDFYCDVLGFDVMKRAPQVLFIAAGGYHHHLAVNVSRSEGQPPSPPDAVGLVSLSVCLPDDAAYQDLRQRIQTHGIASEEDNSLNGSVGTLILDPDRNGVKILVEPRVRRQ